MFAESVNLSLSVKGSLTNHIGFVEENNFSIPFTNFPRGSPVLRAGTQLQSIFSGDLFPSPVLVVLLDVSGYA